MRSPYCVPAASISIGCAARCSAMSIMSSATSSRPMVTTQKPTASFQRVLQRAAIHVVCPACSIAWGWKSPVQPDGGEGLAKHKGGRREAASEGSAEQNRGLTDRNRIGGILGRTSGQRVAKSISIKGQVCRSGRVRGRRSDLPGEISAVVPDLELREPRGDLIAAQKSAEGIVRPCSWRG